MSEYNVKQHEEEDELIIDIRVLFCDVWKGFKKFWWLLLILCSLMAGLRYVRCTASYRPMYESKVSFTVTTQSGYDETNTSYGFYYNQSTAEQMEKLFPYILQTDVMRALIKEELGTDYINGTISASAVPNSNLFTMKAVSSDREAARQILEATLKHLPEVTKYVIGKTKLNIIQPATNPEKAFNKPNYRREVVKGIRNGLLISCVILGLYALLRKTIRKVDDFQSVLNMKCLGVLPQVRFKKYNRKIDKTISIRNDKTGRPFRESVKSFGLKAERQMKEKDEKVLMVTSTLPGEGKSMAAMNLALTLGERKKVLLIDMDMRNPSLAKYLGVSTKMAGLEMVLKGKATPEEVIQKLDNGIYFLGVQKCRQKTSELLTKKALPELIHQYRHMVDYIIIDTPPCGTIADAMTISNVCDGIIYVIRQDTAKQSQILDAIQYVSSQGTRILGGILNGAEGSVSGYGYGYGKYGYGKYGYGRYGYGRYGYGRYGYGRYGESRDGRHAKEEKDQ